LQPPAGVAKLSKADLALESCEDTQKVVDELSPFGYRVTVDPV